VVAEGVAGEAVIAADTVVVAVDEAVAADAADTVVVADAAAIAAVTADATARFSSVDSF
jgi:hypothetical protein